MRLESLHPAYTDRRPAEAGGAPAMQVLIVAARHGAQLAAQLGGREVSCLESRADQAANLVEDGFRGVLLVDCRGAVNEAVLALEVLEPVVLRHGLPMLVLVRRADQAILPTLLQLGATHFLPAPFSTLELAQSVRFAYRYLDRQRMSRVETHPSPASRAHDSVTGLATEAFARNRIDELAEAEVEGGAAALVIIAISRFNRINARFGRSFADKLLRAVSQRLLRLAVNSNIGITEKGRRHAIRMGGAEFAFLLEPPFDLRDAVMLAQQAIEVFDRPFVIDSILVHLSCRAGIATAADGQETADGLFGKAALALDSLRLQGPNSFAVHDPTREGSNAMSDNLEADLRQAIRSQSLDVMFQPQVNLASGKVTGFEALARWTHPQLGPVETDAFLSIAEDAEILPQLGEHILQAAIRHARNWSQNLAVNVAPAQLRLPDFDVQMKGVLQATSFDPRRLTLEITETALIDDFQSVAEMMARIKRLGVRLAIDDFGTGHASYSYLKQLPFDYLKIDRSFVNGMMRDRRDRAMIRSIIEMAGTLGMTVVAEGVETEAQAEQLMEAGCTAYQGYLCSEPMQASQIAAFLASWSD